MALGPPPTVTISPLPFPGPLRLHHFDNQCLSNLSHIIIFIIITSNMPSLISTSAVAVTALLGLMAARPTAAAQWELIAHVQDFCPSNPGDQWFNWSGSDSDCHSFADPKGGECLFTTVNDQGTFEGPACSSAKHPDTVTSINYLDGNDNGKHADIEVVRCC